MHTYAKPFLSDFSRRQWASTEARRIWEPRISRIGAQFAAAELEAVERGIRPAALQNIAPGVLPELSRKAAEKGLTVIPLGTQGHPETYAAAPVPLEAGQAWDYRAVVARLEDARAFVGAWGKDDDRLGELLGYPACCRRFFLETWAAGSFDPTWYMEEKNAWYRPGPLEANPLLRWLGVRLVPHMPCSFKCAASVEFGRELAGLMAPRERAWAEALLSMPTLWSAVNSIGEVQTPIVSLNFRTDPAPTPREIRREGTFPEAGARGIRFPYQAPPARAAEIAAEYSELGDPLVWRDNGFGSLEALERAHQTVAAVVPPSDRRTVLDLGCGNGLLARRLAGPYGAALGVEKDPGRARRARLENLSGIIEGDLFAAKFELLSSEPDLVLLMPGRLLEGELVDLAAEELIQRIRGLGGELLVYAYADWLDEGLETLCRGAGLEGELIERQTAIGVEAGVWRFQ